MYFHKYGAVFRKLFPSYQWKVNTCAQEIYLTFDDGPVPEVTEFVLDTLVKYDAKATFFCVGENITKHPQIYHRLKAEGHSIGNHTYNHLNARKVQTEEYFSNIEKAQAVIGEVGDKLFRPPYGRLKSPHIKALKKLNYKIVMWDVLSGDFDPHLDQKKALQKTIDATTHGSIVLMHDNPKHFNNLTFILPRYMEHFNDLGFKFKALSC